jgi:hypothetical protein
MLQLTEQQLDMLCELPPDHPPRPKGGRPRTDKLMAIKGIFWILDNGAKWKDLPASGVVGTHMEICTLHKTDKAPILAAEPCGQLSCFSSGTNPRNKHMNLSATPTLNDHS